MDCIVGGTKTHDSDGILLISISLSFIITECVGNLFVINSLAIALSAVQIKLTEDVRVVLTTDLGRRDRTPFVTSGVWTTALNFFYGVICVLERLLYLSR